MTSHSSSLMHKSSSPEEAENVAPISAGKNVEFAAALLSGLLLAAIIALILWGTNKGFCITDEAYYLLVSSDPHRYNCSVTKFGFLLNKLPMLSSSEVINGRLWQLLLQITGATILSIGFSKSMGRTGPLSYSQQFIFWSLAVSGSLLIFSMFPLSASYNTLVATTTFASVGFLLWAQTVEKNRKILYLLSGAFAGLVVFSKVTSALLLFPLLLALLFAERKSNKLATGLALVACGAALSTTAYFLFVEPFATCIPSFLQASDYFRQTGLYTSELAINKYVLSLLKLALHVVLYTGLIFILSFCTNFAGQIFAKKRESLSLPLPLVFTGWALITFYFAGYFNTCRASVEAFYIIPALLVAAFIGLNLHKNLELPIAPTNLHLLLLAGVPLVCSMGTNNEVIAHTKIFVAPLVLIGLFLSLKLSDQLRSRAPFLAVAALFIMVIGSQFITGFIKTPYGIPLSMLEQKHVSVAPKLQKIKQALGAKSFFDSYFAMLLAGGFQKGDTIIAAYNMPGLVYAADGRSVKFATFLPGKIGRTMFEASLAELKRESPNQFFVVTNYDGDKILEQSFATAGYKFPDDFQRMGTLICPYDAPSVDITTGKTDLSDLHNRISILRYRQP